jgi:hypothetical protein
MKILAALIFALQGVPDYHQIPKRNLHTEQACNDEIVKVEQFVSTYHSYVSRHEMDEGGNLTADEGAYYRGEADRFVRPGLAQLREMRFSNVYPEDCHYLAETMLFRLTHEIVAKRFGPHYGLKQRRDGTWGK